MMFDRATPVGCAGGTPTIPADDCRAADGYINRQKHNRIGWGRGDEFFRTVYLSPEIQVSRGEKN